MANTIADMLAMETAEPDKTLTPIDVFGEKSKDADDVFEKLSNIVGAIQSNPAYDEEGNLKYKGGYPGQGSFIDPFDLIPGLGAVGASIRGGKVAKSTMEQLWDIAKKSNVKVEHPSKWGWSKKMIDDFVNDVDWTNKISKAKILNQKILSGKGSTGKVGKFKTDPDKEELLDTISAYLTRSKN